jgi:threonine dehydrogenase-like Zn-dependent dehydrogenase
MGLSRVIAVEPEPFRRQFALEVGADAAYSSEDTAGAGSSRPRSRIEPVDFAIIGPGSPEVISQSLTYIKGGGTAILFTPTPSGIETPLDLGDLYFRGIRLVPSYSCGPEDTRSGCQLLRHNRIQPERLITHRFPLVDVQTAYDTARQGGSVLKVLIELAKEPSHANQ